VVVVEKGVSVEDVDVIATSVEVVVVVVLVVEVEVVVVLVEAVVVVLGARVEVVAVVLVVVEVVVGGQSSMRAQVHPIPGSQASAMLGSPSQVQGGLAHSPVAGSQGPGSPPHTGSPNSSAPRS
jgi:hypothetical protein